MFVLLVLMVSVLLLLFGATTEVPKSILPPAWPLTLELKSIAPSAKIALPLDLIINEAAIPLFAIKRMLLNETCPAVGPAVVICSRFTAVLPAAAVTSPSVTPPDVLVPRESISSSAVATSPSIVPIVTVPPLAALTLAPPDLI